MRLKFECPECGTKWEYDLTELDNVTYFKNANSLVISFMDYETKCENCDGDVRDYLSKINTLDYTVKEG